MEKTELHQFHRKFAVELFNKVWDLFHLLLQLPLYQAPNEIPWESNAQKWCQAPIQTPWESRFPNRCLARVQFISRGIFLRRRILRRSRVRCSRQF